MLKEESNGAAAANSWARVCDTCRSAPCTVYCRADSAYLCSGCDATIHAANRVASRHERVSVCEACERAPAAFLCKADAASLCTACDADIHSANPLARRHQRVPILPISGCQIMVGSTPADTTEDGFLSQEGDEEVMDEEDEDEAASWLLLNPVKNSNNHNSNNDNPNNNNNGFLFGVEVDEYLDLVEYNSSDQNQFSGTTATNDQHNYGVPHKISYGGDSVVPVQYGEGKVTQMQMQQKHNFHQLGMEYESSKAAYGYDGSISHTVSVSSMDVGVVPDSTMSEMSVCHPRTPKGTIDLFNGPTIQMPTQLSPMDREARVLRYREKKKTRKFEKTIRYASRKAYAETRPRIKGRFAKRTDIEVEVDQMFSTSLMGETGYGIVPSY
nr:constans [Fragaria x ananassa subsp. ananassa]